MNRNALTEQRRETVIGLLKGMNIKKSTVGGFDKDDVYECMQQLCDLYEKNIEELENAYEGEINTLKERYQKYDDNNELYVSLIMEAKKSSNDIINQAKTEVESILAEGREQVAIQEKELAELRVGMDAEKTAMTAELNAYRAAVEAEKAAIKAEADAEKEKVTAMKNKYSQQLNSMEEEFEEIKTNVLRTAGKLDSLKSKLGADDEPAWNMMEEMDAIELPAADIQLEDIIEAPVVEGSVEVAEPAVEETVEIELPEEEAIEIPAEDFAVLEELVAEAAADEDAEVEAPVEEAEETETLTLEDLIAPEDPVEELSFDDIEIDLPELEEIPAEEAPVEEAPAELEEISFEGLEDLFKEDK